MRFFLVGCFLLFADFLIASEAGLTAKSWQDIWSAGAEERVVPKFYTLPESGERQSCNEAAENYITRALATDDKELISALVSAGMNPRFYWRATHEIPKRDHSIKGAEGIHIEAPLFLHAFLRGQQRGTMGSSVGYWLTDHIVDSNDDPRSIPEETNPLLERYRILLYGRPKNKHVPRGKWQEKQYAGYQRDIFGSGKDFRLTRLSEEEEWRPLPGSDLRDGHFTEYRQVGRFLLGNGLLYLACKIQERINSRAWVSTCLLPTAEKLARQKELFASFILQRDFERLVRAFQEVPDLRTAEQFDKALTAVQYDFFRGLVAQFFGEDDAKKNVQHEEFVSSLACQCAIQNMYDWCRTDDVEEKQALIARVIQEGDVDTLLLIYQDDPSFRTKENLLRICRSFKGRIVTDAVRSKLKRVAGVDTFFYDEEEQALVDHVFAARIASLSEHGASELKSALLSLLSGEKKTEPLVEEKQAEQKKKKKRKGRRR